MSASSQQFSTPLISVTVLCSFATRFAVLRTRVTTRCSKCINDDTAFRSKQPMRRMCCAVGSDDDAEKANLDGVQQKGPRRSTPGAGQQDGTVDINHAAKRLSSCFVGRA